MHQPGPIHSAKLNGHDSYRGHLPADPESLLPSCGSGGGAYAFTSIGDIAR